MKKPFLFLMLFVAFSLSLTDIALTQEIALDDLLNLNLADLTHIKVVTASKIPLKINEVPSTVRIVTAEQIKRNQYNTLEDALADLPGFQFRNINGYNSYVFMRGVPSQNNLILVLIDGIQVNELNSGGFYGGAQYNLANVERIEVVYGPAAALYGTNAISGVINLVTKTPKQCQGGEFNTQLGSFHTLNTDGSFGYWNQDRELGVRLSALYKTSEKAKLAGKAGDDNWTKDLDTVEDDYTMDLNLIYHQMKFGLNVLNKQSSSATYSRSVGTIYRDHDTWWNIRFVNAYLKYDVQLIDQLGVMSQCYYRNTTVLDNSVLVVTDTSQIGYYRPNDLLGWESIFNLVPCHRINFISGIIFESENLAQGYSKTYSESWNVRPPSPPKPPMERNTLFSLYEQCRYFPYSGIELYAGVRYDNSSVYDQVVTPRFALVYNHNRLTGKLLYSEAFRAPKPWDYTDGSGNTDLEPEEMTSYEIYFAYRNSDFLLDMSIYHNILSNIFVKEDLANSWRWVNQGEVNTLGFETSLEYKTGPIQSYFNYTFNASDDAFDHMLPEVSKHKFNLGMQYQPNDRAYIKLRGTYTGRRKNNRVIATTGSAYVDAAFVLYVTLSYKLSSLVEVQLAVNNMLDTEYYHTSNLAPDRYRQPQRAVFFKVCLSKN